MSTRPLIFSVNKQVVTKEVPIPKLGPNDVLVKVRAVALSSAETDHIDYEIATNSAIGGEFAGDVVEIGSAVTKAKVGDTISGLIMGGDDSNPEYGGFSTFVKAQEDFIFQFPKPLTITKESTIAPGPIRTYEQASSLPMGLVTVAMGLEELAGENIGARGAKSGYALIYGAASSLGFVAAQLYKELGYEVIAVASAKHAQTFTAAGIKHLIDYHDEDWPEKARKIAGDNILAAFDAIATPKTLPLVCKTVTQTKPIVILHSMPLEGTVKEAGPNMKLIMPYSYFVEVLVKVYAGERFEGEQRFIDDRPVYLGHVDDLTRADAFSSLPIKIVGENLDAIPAALDLIRKGVSGEKLVIRI